jgi:hypothetical protein
MKIIYVAGPYRADGWHNVWENIMAARDVARKLWLEGWAVVCPHANSILMDGPDIPARTFLDGDIEILRRCDALFAMRGWERSEGARAEIAEAKRMGLEIIYS